MDVVKEIIDNSAIGPFSNGFKSVVLSLFVSIVCMLLVMLTILILNGSSITFHYGY